MLTITCDRCGYEEKSIGVVSQQYKYGKNFEELTKCHRVDCIVDLCKKCFNEYTDSLQSRPQSKGDRIFGRGPWF